MISEIDVLQAPQWLEGIAEDAPLPPLEQLLVDSLYYPACGLNGTPVKYLAGNIYSFIYADYGVSKQELLHNLNGSGPDCGIKHYHSVCQREVFRHEIVPSGWSPAIVPRDRRAVRRLLLMQQPCRPFGHWSVWERNEDASPEVGPRRFSFFYLGGEMSAIYQGLYCRLGIAPKILAIIQPGAMGGEWERVTSNESFFKQVVSANPAGLPQYLLHGGFGHGFYEWACWREYQGERIIQLPERYAGLWKLNSEMEGAQDNAS